MSKHKGKNKNTYKRKPKYKYKKVNKKCGSAYIHSSYNNTIVTITDDQVIPFLGPLEELLGSKVHDVLQLMLRNERQEKQVGKPEYLGGQM